MLTLVSLRRKVNFILGLLVITASSIMNSFGLNLMQYDVRPSLVGAARLPQTR